MGTDEGPAVLVDPEALLFGGWMATTSSEVRR
jgi:hypothetical protein